MQLISLNEFLSWSMPLFFTVVTTIAIYWLLSRIVTRQANNRLYLQLGQVALALLALIALILVLPFHTETRAQLLSLFGLVVTAVIALSSTTFVSNAMAGLTLKAIGSFHTGDFIRVADHFGRVSAKALLHTEIQSEDRDTITLPNLYVITNPVQVVDQSGTLISANVSIGYDVSRQAVRAGLLDAAAEADLTDPFVQILELGNFAVTYKVTGFLEDTSKLVSKKTELMGKILDHLHADGIEVMTPNVMDQRPLAANQIVLPMAPSIHPPTASDSDADTKSGKAERMMFDKAELAARVAKFKAQCRSLESEIEQLEAAEEDNTMEITWRKSQLLGLQKFIATIDDTDD